jgi:hypothetical protein
MPNTDAPVKLGSVPKKDLQGFIAGILDQAAQNR